MSTPLRPHHATTNVAPPHGVAMNDIVAPPDGIQGCHNTTAYPQMGGDINVLCGVQAVGEGDDGGVHFDDFFFQNIPPEGNVDAAQSSVFEGFCFDDICDDGAWPAGVTAMGNGPEEDTENQSQLNAPQPFEFFLPEDATSTSGTAVVAEGTITEGAFDMGVGVAHPTRGVADVPSVPVPVSTEVLRRSAPREANEMSGEAANRPSNPTNDTIATTSKMHFGISNDSSSHSNGGGNLLVEGGDATKEVLNNVPAVPLGSLRQSLKLTDSSVCSTVGSTTTTVGAAPRVPRESVDDLLRRANQILSEGKLSDATEGAATGGHESNNNQSDTLFSAQVSHWLRRCVEVQESSLVAVADLQLRMTQTMRMFSTHTGISSALGQQYGKTPVVLTFPLVLTMMESLLEEG
ncbi:hypothetical protein MOQ_008881 [Trypanosoma cruzi marinkellei]|uniref:Uncharacterized protein n=1 Tax=Trypanosoma cruzi marinkellei TaxID=85056 RepID=K2NED3_TRYCR|nr:hypothetical protein MOQ_008881 [Trypanosoma cruzi marinkellei]